MRKHFLDRLAARAPESREARSFIGEAIGRARARIFNARGEAYEPEKKILTLAEESQLEELLHAFEELGMRADEDIQDPRRGRAAFDLSKEALVFLNRIMDKYENAATDAVMMLGRSAIAAATAGDRWYEDTGRKLTAQQWTSLKRRPDAERGDETIQASVRRGSA